MNMCFYRYLLALLLAPFGDVLAQPTDTLVLHFEFDRADLSSTAVSALMQIFKTNDSSRSVQNISLSGYCDNTGSNTYNDALSVKRAIAVKDYLLNLGVSAAAISGIQGFGKQYPLNSNQTAALRAINRRVLITFQYTPTHSLSPAHNIDSASVAVKPAITTPSPAPVPKPRYKSIYESIRDSSTVIGTRLRMNINFPGSRHYILNMSIPILEELLRAMNENPALQISIEGYVCCTSDDRDGLDDDTHTYTLSVERAKAVFEYLREHGIAATRMQIAGFGGSNKIYPEEITPEQQAMNRRVEIRILNK
jgi:outer membrane protein OmpA-like peptidoglycan-associated protein